MARSADTGFEEFVRDCSPRLVRAFVAQRGVEGAADAAAEAMAYAFEHWDRMREMANPVGYLYRVGQSRTRPRKPLRLPAPSAVGLPDIEPALVPALLELPETQRTAVWLVARLRLELRGGGRGHGHQHVDGGQPRQPRPGPAARPPGGGLPCLTCSTTP